jgi:hypothetical protein
MTISDAISLQKAVRERISALTTIRNANLVTTRRHSFLSGGAPEERVDTEVKYDAKKVDTKITELETFLYKVDCAIKKTNAITEIGITADINQLLSPIE